MTVGELKERLDRDFQDHETLTFDCDDAAVFIRSIEHSGLGEGDCVVHLSADEE